MSRKPQKDIEVILMRQLASYLAIPIFLVDVEGNLLFYNGPAEVILGRRYHETGEISLEEWATLFTATAADGSPLLPEERPLIVALQKHRAIHRSPYWIQSPDGTSRRVEVTAFPLQGQGGRHLGAVAIFWEEGENSLQWNEEK